MPKHRIFRLLDAARRGPPFPAPDIEESCDGLDQPRGLGFLEW